LLAGSKGGDGAYGSTDMRERGKEGSIDFSEALDPAEIEDPTSWLFMD
jgi:hypothetical protein